LRSAAVLTDVDALPSAIALRKKVSIEGSQEPLARAEQIKGQNAEKMALNNLSSAAVYRGIFPGADLEYTVLPGRIKENIVQLVPQSELHLSF